MTSKKQKILNMYFEGHLKPIDISKKLKISKSAVTQVLVKDSRYQKIKSERKAYNQKRHNEDTKAYMKEKRQIIQYKNSADDLILKKMHDQASSELSAPRKLSDLAYRNWNKSAYTYNQDKKRFEFSEELGRSVDVKKYIKVDI